MTLAPDFDFRNSVVLEGVAESLAQASPADAPQVEITAYAPGSMTVAVTSAAAGFLVVSDPYTPGWVAQVDGVETEIHIANHAFRAVAVAAGNHTVSFHYQPASFAVGAWISAISLILLLLVLLLGQRAGNL
jgi:uncharacterized membrane protein YfhO